MSDWLEEGWREHLLPEFSAEEAPTAFPAQFEAHEKLQAYVWEHRAHPRSRLVADYHMLLFALFARATLTYRATRHLCLGGYHQQAEMLTRSLFEDFVIASWACLPSHREEALQRVADHFTYTNLLRYDAWVRLELPGRDDAMSELEERREELVEKFGPHGGPWTPSVYSMLQEVLPSLPSDTRRHEVEVFFRLRHQANNQQLHASASAIDRVTTISVEGETAHFQVSQSPDLDEEPLTSALFSSMACYGWFFRQVADERRLDAEAFERFFLQLQETFTALLPSARRKIGRNDPCPCGSGRKYKACHAA